MKSVSTRHVVVIGLVLLALYTVVTNLWPLLAGNDDSAELYETVLDEDAVDEVDTGGYALKPVQTSILFWNDAPSRDPFSDKVNRKMMKNRQNANHSHRRMPSLTGFVAGEQSRLAVLNGQVLGVGEKVSGYVVHSIAADGVELERAGKRTLLTLEPLQ